MSQRADDRPARDLPWAEETHRAHLLPKWVGHYARNRTLPWIVHMALATVGLAALFGMNYTLVVALLLGRTGPALAALVVTLVILGWLFWLGSKGGRRMTMRLARRLYDLGEGQVAEDLLPPTFVGRRVADVLFVLVMVTLTVCLSARWIPPRLEQPLQALLLAPFMVYWYGFRWRRHTSPFMLAWPALLLVHGALLAAGAPLYISGGPEDLYRSLNMLLPMVGYGLLCALAGHLYSRFALRRLRTLAGADTPEKEAP